jgi:aminobenzoyl-glutamate utilization protein A
METRGYTTELNAYMEQRARQVLEGAARMHDCGLEIRVAGQTATAVCDQPLVELVQQVARRLPGVTRVPEHPHQAGGSEDATFMMRRVQERGGLATYIGVCSEVNHGHHTYTFDFQEDTMLTATRVLALAAYRAGVERPRRG